MTKIEPRLLKGFRDYGPEDQLIRQDLFRKIQAVFERFGFLPLSTPVLEYKEILMGKYGDDEKLVYSFQDNGGRDVAMRYDLTVPLARYVAQNQGRLSLPFKRYQIAPVWRADNPQKGRLREFYQCDIDAVGTASPMADAEVIACLCQALEAVGVTRYRVRLNNRKVFSDVSPEAVRCIDKVDKIGRDGVIAEMRERGLSEDQIAKAVAILDMDASTLPESIGEVLEAVNAFGIQGRIEFDPSIARGLDYYTGTVFEIYVDGKPEYGSVCSGGRYDTLVDQFTDAQLPAVGGSIGIDRLLGALEELGLLQRQPVIRALIVNMDENLGPQYAALATELRGQGINTELYYESARLEKQFKYADSKNIQFAVIVGEEEAGRNVVKLKNLQTREQEEVPQAELAQRLQS